MPTTKVTNDESLPADALAALRSATARHHDVVDRSMPLSVAVPSLRDYADHLRLLAAWLAPMEQWLSTFDDGPQDARLLPSRSHAHLIATDLAHGLTPAAMSATPVSQACWPERASGAFRWGVCYVVEGSQLGGAVLYKRLRTQLAPHPLAYLGQDATQLSARWKGYLNSLQHEVTTPAQIAQACLGAQTAFENLLALLAAPRMATAEVARA